MIMTIIVIIIIMMTTMMMMTIAAEMWTSERPGAPGHHAAKDQEGKLAHAGYKRNYHDYDDHHALMINTIMVILIITTMKMIMMPPKIKEGKLCGIRLWVWWLWWTENDDKNIISDIWALDQGNDLHLPIQCHPGEIDSQQCHQCHHSKENFTHFKDNLTYRRLVSQWVKLVLLAGVMSTCLGGVFVGIRWRCICICISVRICICICICICTCLGSVFAGIKKRWKLEKWKLLKVFLKPMWPQHLVEGTGTRSGNRTTATVRRTWTTALDSTTLWWASDCGPYFFPLRPRWWW